MKVSLIQMDIKFAEPLYNYDHAAELIRRAAAGKQGKKPDVILLPETWNTGFFPTDNLQELSDHNGERTLKLIGTLAKEQGINIVAGSIANKKNGKIYNTSYIFDRNGKNITSYDKTHLFSPMGEDKHFSKGDNLVTFELDGVFCGIIICYDIRFVEMVRSLALKKIDVLFVVAQWPKKRINHWQILNRARAIENQIYVCCVNSCAHAGEVKFGGHSAIISPWGEVLLEAGEDEQIICGDLDLSTVTGIRNNINVYIDRRPELYSGVID